MYEIAKMAKWPSGSYQELMIVTFRGLEDFDLLNSDEAVLLAASPDLFNDEFYQDYSDVWVLDRNREHGADMFALLVDSGLDPKATVKKCRKILKLSADRIVWITPEAT